MKNTPLRILLGGSIVVSSLMAVGAASASTSSRTALPCAASVATGTKSVINITFWESMPSGLGGAGGNHGALMTLINAFNSAYAGKIHVNDVQQTGGYTQTWSQYVASLANHTSPNVVMFDQYNTQSAVDTKSILPVGTCIKNNAVSTTPFSANLMGAYKVGTTIEGMPFSASVPVMYYNKAAFAAAGISAPPTTMTQLLADQTKLKATKVPAGAGNGAGSNYKYGVSLKYDPWEVNTWLALADKPVVNNGNGHTARTTAAVFNNTTSQGYVAALQKVAKAGNGLNVYNPQSSNILVAYGNLLDIAQNRSAITFDTTAALGTIQSLLPTYKNVSLGVAPLPTLTGTHVNATPPGGNGLFINTTNSTAAQQSASWVFINFLTSAAHLASWDHLTGYLPTRSDELTAWKALNNANQNLWYGVGYKELSVGHVDVNTEGPMIGNYDQVNNDVGGALQSILLSPYASVTTALNNAQHTATSHILSYNASVH